MTAQSSCVPPLPARRPARRERLLLSCAATALATVALPAQRADAQAFQGSETVVNGTAIRTITGDFTETITVGTSTATINWSPYDNEGTGTIDFLPAGHTATFTNNPGSTADFTVLNRIVPTDPSRAVAFNGTVISQLQDLSQNVTPGGSVWFYSPGGMVVGASAVFDVGSLLLTTNDVTSFSTDANGFTGRFVATPGSTSAITIAPGAQITATPDNSYVALVAPRVEQGGAVRVNGTAAYAAGEDVTMTMNQGLFDIQVTVGTGDSNGIVHTGSTGGPSSTGTGDYHRAYLVAVPKNQALTMLLGGSIGFDAATSAAIDNGDIILRAGWSVTETPSGLSGNASGTPNAGIDIGPGTYSSDVNAMSWGNIIAAADSGSITFAGDVALNSYGSPGSGNVWLGASNGNSVTVGGQAVLFTSLSGFSSSARIYADTGGSVDIDGGAILSAISASGSGGTAAIIADNATIDIGGVASVVANAQNFSAATAGNSIDAFGGSASVVATNNATITAGSLSVGASSTGQANAGTGDTISGDGHGGFAEVRSDSGSEITVAGYLTVTAQGFGGGMQAGATQGGNGYGGSAEVTTTGGTITVGGDLSAYAEGFGGGVFTSAPGQLLGGDGFGGTVVLSASGGPIAVTGAGLVSTYAIGGANAGGDGGDGEGGYSYVEATNGGSLAFGAGGLTVSSSGVGGSGGDLGGFGYGGSTLVSLDGGDLTSAGELQLWANGFGGAGATGGDGTGGSSAIDIFSSGGTLTAAGETRIEGAGHGGAGIANASGTGGAGGDGIGGDASIYISSGIETEGSPVTLELGNVFVTANGTGGIGGNGATGGAGGDAFGGNAYFYLGSAGTADFTELQVFSTSRGGAGGTGSSGAGGAGGLAEGGFAWIDVAGTMTADIFSAYARAFGGNGGTGTTAAGAGGDAFGGSAFVDVDAGGSIAASVLADIATTAFGGSGSTGGQAAGGDGQFSVDGALTAASLRVDASATGGVGSGGDGGQAAGGSSEIDIVDGNLTVTGDTEVLANAVGGSGTANGGIATGGAAYLYAESSGAGTLASTLLEASGEGGAGGSGGTAGTGAGGIAFVQLFESDLTANLTLTANGDTTGGIALLELLGSSLTANSVAMTVNGGQSGGIAYTLLESGDLGQTSSLDTDAFSVQANGGNTGGVVYLFTEEGSSAYLGNATLAANGPSGSGGIFIGSGGLDGEAAQRSGPIYAPGDPGISANSFAANSSGSIFIGSDLDATQTLALTAGSDISVANLFAGTTVTVSAGGNFTVADVTAGTSAAFTAGGVAAFRGTVSAPAITVTSADLDITGDLGVQGVTETIVLNAVSDGEPIVIGGGEEVDGATGQDGLQWRLTRDESIESDSVVINAIGANEGQAPDVLLLDVEIEGSQTGEGGGTSHVELNTDGSVLVEGLVLFLDSGADDVLAINAGGSIQINTSTGGGIGMVGPNETPAGTLLLTAADIWSGDQALLDALNLDPSYAGRNDALTTNPGADDQRGRIVAGGIEITVGNSLLVQNTGTAASPAGINVGAGGLVVRSSSPDTTVFAFGQGVNGDGTPLTGEAFVGTIDFDSDEGGFTSGSRFNGCALSGPCVDPGPGPGPEPEPEPVPPAVSGPDSVLGPVEVVASGDVETESEGEGSLSVTLASALFETGDVVLDQLIDEGVTSGGDSSLWFGGDDDDEEEDEDDDGEDK
ncbi:hypothetical protein [Sphingomonas sp.]|uniref:beta strand repeat-containing protein n=1 Tax=Sphingomonas sp. TaxID=28214 RepID=UPI00286E7D7D|nr:hypothetical protein [Sphingomonas sp.]